MVVKPPKSRRPYVPAWIAAAGLLLTLPSTALWAGPPLHFENLAALSHVAEATAAGLLGPRGAQQRLQVGPIEPELRLRLCDRPVTGTRAPGLKIPDRVVVELRCAGSNPWHIYVPVRVIGVTAVAVAAHALVAGTVLTAADITVERRDLTLLPPGFFNAAAIAVGLTAARPIAGGTILTNQLLLGTPAVRRGQTVTLVANAGGISVRTNGRALMDGFVNQRVKVENLSSGKIIEGIARSDQTVEIIVP